MELQQLRYFLAVARLKNFSRAAERCNVAQPSLSQQIIKLEEELGSRLLERTRREARLTEAGRAFLPHAEKVLAELELACDRVNETRGVVRGRVALGVIPTVAPYFLPGLLGEFSAMYPEIQVSVTEATTSDLVRATQAGELDLALTSLPIVARGIEATEVFAEELWLALPKKHPLARRNEDVRIGELSEEPFMLLQDGHCLAGQSLEFCTMRGFAPKVTFRSAQMETIQAFVAAGLGVSMVPAMARREGAGVAYRRLHGKTPARKIGLVRAEGRELTGAARALADFTLKRSA
jgi:LysR family transcriptional regulator, hydrogen peroxide-inducible genes activator